MKTLADLKRNCHLYKWRLVHNSWYKEVPPHQSEYRTVNTVSTRGFTLNTCKDGSWTQSHVDFPKAKELYMGTNDDGSINLIITRRMENEATPDHQMVYKLEQHIS
jgi:hypothetical protein